MTIKSSKSTILLFIVIQVVLALFSLFLYLNFERTPLEFHIAVFAVLQLYMLRMYFIYGRTIRVDADGCTVKFLLFKKFYRWSDLKTKRIEDYRQRLGRYDPYAKGVVFSKKENFRTPQSLTLSLYLQFCLNPFRFFFVLFKPANKNGSGAYEVDEQEFLEKMAEYGVELDDRYNRLA